MKWVDPILDSFKQYLLYRYLRHKNIQRNIFFPGVRTYVYSVFYEIKISYYKLKLTYICKYTCF